MTRITPAEADAIRAALAQGEPLRAVARRFKRSPSHVAAIRDGRIHKAPGPTLAERVEALEARVAALEEQEP